jgi:hypothetical protein
MLADSSASGRTRLVLTLLAAGGFVLFLASRVTDAPPATPTNLILISLDTLRADHIGPWGYGPPTTPRLDEFFSEATVFRRAVAQANATIASHALTVKSSRISGSSSMIRILLDLFTIPLICQQFY